TGIPLTLNRRVRLAIRYFQTKGRYVFTKWLERSGKYEHIVKGLIKEKGLPEELYYLPMIESGFNPSARSYARAVGMWQFISATGRYYGLRHNWWFDERRDVIKSTNAALEHLKDLNDRFGHWYLALAGYNCNPRRVDYNIRRYNTRDFWKLRRLPRQTRNYVPTFLAATLIAKHPKKFGFFVNKEQSIEIDTVRISESIDLNKVAELTDTSYAYIREINPAVLRWVTPPGVDDFTLYLPAGKKEMFKKRYPKIPDSQKRSWVRHRIRHGETLSTIAAKYHTSMYVIRSNNNIRGSLIRAGDHLLIPVPQNKKHYYSYKPVSTSTRQRTRPARVTNVPGHEKKEYKVKKGDTLGGIAELFNTRASKIRAWNGLRYGQYIYPDQKLTIWVPEGGINPEPQYAKKTLPPGEYYTVRYGDTLWDIAHKYGLSVSDLKRLNELSGSRIKPGDKLRVSKN
ncbi:MAG: LysM peptidoglycan-binding domain-containing protein, partial [Caldithrix sp.]|nr:LysM peptidoglycan-binding domain-containing protein [Caldithrix sp.]